MFPAPLFLFLLVLISPLCLIFDGPLAYGLVTAVAAVLVAIVALRIRSGEAEFLSKLFFPIVLVAALPVLIMLIQLMPSKSIGLANSIWESASTATSRPLAGRVTIDVGATLICLVRYFSFFGLMFAAAAIAIDRRRASWVLSVLTVAATASALIALVAGYSGFLNSSTRNDGLNIIAAMDVAVLGALIAIAMVLQIRERAFAASSMPTNLPLLRLMLVFCAIAIAICFFTVFKHGSTGAFFALAAGVITFLVAAIVRRFQLDAWGYSAVVAIVAVIAIAALALRPGEKVTDPTVALAASPQSPLVSLTGRILAETRWLGTGAGTFSAVLPIYGDVDELSAGTMAPSAAAALAIEMGKPFLWATLLASIVLVLVLFRGAARRGRDSFYPAAGASCVVAIVVLAFNNGGLFNTTVLLISSVAVGLAIAQGRSRTV